MPDGVLGGAHRGLGLLVQVGLSRRNLAAVCRALGAHHTVKASIEVQATGPGGEHQTYPASVSGRRASSTSAWTIPALSASVA